MNVLVVIHYPMFGGPHNRVLRLNRGLTRRGWNTTALLPDEPGNAAERLRACGINVVRIPLRRFRASRDPRTHLGFAFHFAGDVARIRRQIRKHDVDLVVVGGLLNPHAAIAARLEGIPVVWQIVDSRTPPGLRQALMLLVRRLSSTIMFGGNALVDLHLDRRSTTTPWFVCSPPVDLDRFFPTDERRQETRRRYRIPDGALLVGTVSNLTPAKGVEYFIGAAARIYQAEPRSWFMVVGAHYQSHRHYIAGLEAAVRRSPIPPDRFLFVGERTDTENFYPAMDVKLISSVPRSEGTTTTAMEALACAVSVVAANVGAVSEVVEDGVTGFVVPPLDDLALAEKTLALLRNPGLRAQFGANGRRRMQRFSVEACCDRYVEIFEVAMSKSRSLTPALESPSPLAAREPPSPLAGEGWGGGFRN